MFKNHLGVAYLRAALARDGIVTTQYLNQRPGGIKATAVDITRHHPRIVGFTVYDSNMALALALARAVKGINREIRVVFGGPTVTFGAADILRQNDVVDACVMGEAEETGSHVFSLLLDSFPKASEQPGLGYRCDGAVVCNTLPPLVGSSCPDKQSALDGTPSPYLTGILDDGRTGVLSGRGCTHHCQYCAFAALGRKILRLHSIDRVLAELEYIAAQQKRTKANYYVPIQDDAFTLIPKRAKDICRQIADRKLGLALSCITRADAIDDELLGLMREAGFFSISFGLESAVPSVLRATGKVRPPDWPDPDLEPERHFVEQVRKSVLVAKKYGFIVGVSIILGLPTETAEDGAATLRFVKALPVDFYMHNLLWVFPGTPLWESHDRYAIGCEINRMGLPMTNSYAYDVMKIRPRSRCSSEHDANVVRDLTAQALYACTGGRAKRGSVAAVVIRSQSLSQKTAAWLAQILDIGGIVVQVYPQMRRDEVLSRAYEDRCTLNDQMAQQRYHAQILPLKSSGSCEERWQIMCEDVDPYTRHKPDLLTLVASTGPEPLVRWLRGKPSAEMICEVCDYLGNPKELIRFLHGSKGNGNGERLASRPIPPEVKYAGRWFKGTKACLPLSRIEIDEAGQVRSCQHGDPIGIVGDTVEMLSKRVREVNHNAMARRGCVRCIHTECPRCPFPGIDERSYCRTIATQDQTLRFLSEVQVLARLPHILGNHQDQIGG
jgi:anaerobic magnesium-protoporphyrin IX monomethyl ester cyclase